MGRQRLATEKKCASLGMGRIEDTLTGARKLERGQHQPAPP
jgi:hypothetical protein